MARKRKTLVKQSSSIRHICDKLYVNKGKTSVSGIYPYGSQAFTSSVYNVALKKTLKRRFFRLLMWIIADVIISLIALGFAEVYLVFALALVLLLLAANIVSLVCSISSFKGEFLSNIDVSINSIEEQIIKYCNSISISDDPKKNSENYKRLDKLSQVVDSEAIRYQKVRLLLAMQDHFDSDWQYETDTVLLNVRYLESGRSMQDSYLELINRLDPSIIGPATKLAIRK